MIVSLALGPGLLFGIFFAESYLKKSSFHDMPRDKQLNSRFRISRRDSPAWHRTQFHPNNGISLRCIRNTCRVSNNT